MKCIALLHNIVIVVECLHDFSTNNCDSLHANGGTQLKKSRMNNSFAAYAKQTRDLFCGFFHSPVGSVPWQVEAVGDVQKFKVIITLCNYTNLVLHICT